MATQVQICNLALAHLGQTGTTIANLVTDKGLTATQCRIHYDVAREFVLADHDWNFAEKVVYLADIGNPPQHWAYRYDYPSDCLKFRHINGDARTGRRPPFRVMLTEGGQRCIVTDRRQAEGVYTADITNTTVFSPGFVEAFSWYLAAALAPALTGDVKKQEMALRVYQSFVGAAQRQDAQESGQDEMPDAPWITAR